MSSDNGYTIVKTSNGTYAAVMYFASDAAYCDEGFDPKRDQEFANPFEAWDWAARQYSEYGVTFSSEVTATIANRFNNSKEK